MAETVYTPDGKSHVLLGNTTRLSLIREYAGNDLAEYVEGLENLADEWERYFDDYDDYNDYNDYDD